MSIMKRRHKQRLHVKFREAVWPTMGWRRTLHYYKHRLFRHGDSTTKVAGGLATGVAAIFNPFLGTHVLQAVFFCWIFRFNPLAGFLGTLAGNPWTYPFVFWLIYKVGVTICGWFGLAHFVALPDDTTMAQMLGQPMDFLHYIFHHPQKLLLPLTLGGYIVSLFVWPITYGLLYWPVYHLRAAYRLQRSRFRHRRQQHNDKNGAP